MLFSRNGESRQVQECLITQNFHSRLHSFYYYSLCLLIPTVTALASLKRAFVFEAMILDNAVLTVPDRPKKIMDPRLSASIECLKSFPSLQHYLVLQILQNSRGAILAAKGLFF
jgi:hypothetical protein